MHVCQREEEREKERETELREREQCFSQPASLITYRRRQKSNPEDITLCHQEQVYKVWGPAPTPSSFFTLHDPKVIARF